MTKAKPSAHASAGKDVMSMTGFGSAEAKVGELAYRVEVKALNHRYLDLKVRLPRELQSAEIALRAFVQSRFQRGSLDLKVERAFDASVDSARFSVNDALAARYLEALRALQAKLGLDDPIRTLDVAAFPEVIQRQSGELAADETWAALQPLVERALDSLAAMRRHEGENLRGYCLRAAEELEAKIALLREKRASVQGRYPERVREKIRAVFESYPLSPAPASGGSAEAASAAAAIQAVIESRVSQELALLADRTDIEEELVRFQGHLEHFRKVFREGGNVGRKVEFILQELGREINTLGNKAQDFAMGEEVVDAKVRLEQLREQVLNIE